MPPPPADGAGGNCGPLTCSGCCQFGSCVFPPTGAACGSNGSPCVQCNPQESCISGQCVTGGGGCTPVSCTNGCCKNDQCLGGMADTACGVAGMNCVDCTLSSGTCDWNTRKCQGGGDCSSSCQGCCQNNQCVDGTSAVACGKNGEACKVCDTGVSCENNNCGGGGGGSYKVILKSANLISSPWTACQEGNCDMYVELWVGSQFVTSSSQTDNNAPTWNEELLTATEQELTSKFEAKVWDEDPWMPDIKIGQCNQTITPAILSAGQVVVKCEALIGSSTSVEVTFEFQST